MTAPTLLRGIAVSPDGETLAVGTYNGGVLLFATRIVAVDVNDSAVDTRTVGWVLLTVGLAGVVPLTMSWLWAGSDRRSRRRTHIDDLRSGRAYSGS